MIVFFFCLIQILFLKETVNYLFKNLILPALHLSVKHKNREEGQAFILVPSTTASFKNKI